MIQKIKDFFNKYKSEMGLTLLIIYVILPFGVWDDWGAF